MLKYDNKIYYDWFYANVTGTFDLFLIGMIGERMIHFLPVGSIKLYNYRKYSLLGLIITTILFLDSISYRSLIYLSFGPCLFAISTISIIILFSQTKKNDKLELTNESWYSIACDTIAPYTFMFYLWHSPLLGYVADKMVIENMHIHYFAMLIVGGLISAYVALLMTKMNNGIIQSILKK